MTGHLLKLDKRFKSCVHLFEIKRRRQKLEKAMFVI